MRFFLTNLSIIFLNAFNCETFALQASRVNESLPNPDVDVQELPKDRPIRTFADYSVIRRFLTHPRFQIVENTDEAEILWLGSHFKNYKYIIIKWNSKKNRKLITNVKE